MEVYVPYIVGSTVSAFLGKLAYSYFSSEDHIDDNKLNLDINRNDYELINKKGEKEIFWKPLGSTSTQQSKSIRKICQEECGFTISDKKHHKQRTRILNYISQYERLGHDEFVNKNIKSWKLKELNSK